MLSTYLCQLNGFGGSVFNPSKTILRLLLEDIPAKPATPPKSNIDTKNDDLKYLQCISFQTWLFWVSLLDFRGRV